MKKTNTDRNFDDLAPKFQRKVYGGLKGRIRLSVLKKDLTEFFPKALSPAEDKPLRILDAGSGYGPFSLNMAKLGHMVTLCDISAKMLELASKNIAEKKIKTPVKQCNCPIQDLSLENGPYDLILCHALLEWVNDPKDLIFHLLKHLKKDGILSLTFYNLNGMIFKNLLRANYKKIQDKDYCGWSGSLTPTNPIEPEMVMKWLTAHSLDILCHSGMRVFHDYIFDPEHRGDPETIIEMELKFSRRMPYRDLGRYQHVIVQKTG
jgi:S-adenosylmethionine-dependent methyltransferase